MPTTFRSARIAGALTVVGALTAGVVALTTLTATSITASTGEFTSALSGALIQVNKVGPGSGKLLLSGGSGAYLCIFDSDKAGYTMVRSLNGTLTSTIAGSTMCP